ncbi:MAG: hypothetical protein V1707_02570 [bacterium]
MERMAKRLAVGWWILFILLLVYLLLADIVVTGEWSVVWTPNGRSPSMTDLVPLDRVKNVNGSKALVVDEPVYLDVTAPRPFTSLEAAIEGDKRILAGVKTNKFGFEVTLKELENGKIVFDLDGRYWQKRRVWFVLAVPKEFLPVEVSKVRLTFRDYDSVPWKAYARTWLP